MSTKQIFKIIVIVLTALVSVARMFYNEQELEMDDSFD